MRRVFELSRDSISSGRKDRYRRPGVRISEVPGTEGLQRVLSQDRGRIDHWECQLCGWYYSLSSPPRLDDPEAAERALSAYREHTCSRAAPIRAA